ncbi:ATP-binding protein [Negativicoccus succinicivorans]|uniref:sensor histidine kinase n=1 Tax=Negativicoccus succinicivorans TaxID=620903 RepID=UPI002912AB4E|nr:ATP-binding protein [Negativicoccus succinicivorans]MDU5288551.1 ATP-binding protein [Negativicoccus succinicivorans]
MKKSIYSALVSISIVAVLLTLLASMWFYYSGVRKEAETHLQQMTTVLADGMRNQPVPVDWLAASVAGIDDMTRVTWIDASGKVRFESAYNADQMENHLEREEVKAALANGEGASRRESGTLARETSYYALRLDDGSVLRTAVDRGSLFAIMQRALPGVLGVLAVILIACFFLAGYLTRHLLKPLRQAGEAVDAMISGQPVPYMLGVPELDPILARTRAQQENISHYIDEINDERSRTRHMMDTLTEGVILLDRGQSILDYNNVTAKIFQLTSDVYGQSAAALDQSSAWLTCIQDAMQTGESSTELTLCERIYRVRARRTESSNDDFTVLLVVRDVTETALAEQRRREFSANVSHELNTPLTSIRGYAELLLNGMYHNADEVKNFARRMIQESNRLLGLIQNIMRLSRIEEANEPYQWQNVSLHYIAEQVTDLLEMQSEKKNIRMRVHGDRGYVFGDARLLFELVLNLADNAVKYNREGGSVDVTIRDGEDDVTLTVKDTGVGIPIEQQNYIFERFYRVEQSRSKETGGSGLGLAIVKHIVALHHGELALTSQPKEGTAITVTLPKTQPDAKETEKTQSADDVTNDGAVSHVVTK